MRVYLGQDLCVHRTNSRYGIQIRDTGYGMQSKYRIRNTDTGYKVRIHPQTQNRVQIQDSNARYGIQDGTQSIQMQDTDTEYGIRSLPHSCQLRLLCNARYDVQGTVWVPNTGF